MDAALSTGVEWMAEGKDKVEARGFPDLLEGLRRLRGAVMLAAAMAERGGPWGTSRQCSDPVLERRRRDSPAALKYRPRHWESRGANSLTEATCPICGKTYNIPDGRGRAMVETRFLHHKDACSLPSLGEIVRVQAALAIVDGVDEDEEDFPMLTVHYPSGKERVLEAGDVGRVRDQEAARERFFG